MRGNHHSDVSRHRLQHDEISERDEPRDAGGGGAGGASVLAARRNQMLARPEVLPVLDVHADLHRRLP